MKSPAYPGDFPDPWVMVVGQTYWAYATGSAGSNLQVMSSPDLLTWTAPVDALPVLPAWATAGHTWAPSILQRGQTFIMFYTVRQTSSGAQCISVATSNGSGGPFVDSSPGPLVCQLDHGGSIDPSTFVAPDGSVYLLWKSDDNAIHGTTHLWGQQLSDDARSLVGSRTLLLTQTYQWQAPVIEGPAMIHKHDVYYLFYSANCWASPAAGIGYATCSAPSSLSWTCADQSTTGHWLGTRTLPGAHLPVFSGPSGPSLFADALGATRIAYHAWTGHFVGYPTGVRSLWIDKVSFPKPGSGGIPTIE
jgi:beta-xylosidase